MKKTEGDFGREYAEWGQAQEGFDSPVDIDKILGQTVSIPDGDYTKMVSAGIENPNARDYWEGFNSFFE